MIATITGFLRNTYAPLRGPARTLGVLHLVDSMGNGLFLAGAMVYFVTAAGLPAAQVGLGLSLAGIAGFVSSVLLGKMADRTGARPLLATLLFTLAGCFLLYPLVDSVWFFFLLISLIGALEYGCGPAFGTLIMDLVPEPDRVPARAALRSLFNIGFSAGSLLAVALIGTGSTAWLQLLPLGNAVTFIVSGLLVLRLPATPTPPSVNSGRRFGALRDLPFLTVVGASGLLALHGAVLVVGLPLWLVTRTDLPNFVVPLFLTVNTALVVLFQVVASRGADTIAGAASVARRAGLVCLAACLLLAVTPSAGVWGAAIAAVVALLLFTLAELWQSASAFGLGFGLAGTQNRGEYLGAFNLHIVVQAAIGPALVTYLVVSVGALGWVALGLIFTLSALVIGPAARRAAAAQRLQSGEERDAPPADPPGEPQSGEQPSATARP